MFAPITDEKSLIFNFLLNLYLNRTFTDGNGRVSEKHIQKYFRTFCKKQQVQIPKKNIKDLLSKHNHLIPNFGSHLCIKTHFFQKQYSEHLKYLDNKEKFIQKESPLNKEENVEDNDSTINLEEEQELTFQSAKIRFNYEQFIPSNMGCWICLMNFTDQQKFDDHVSFHKTINNEIFVNNRPTSMRVFYSVDSLSNNLDFTVKTDLEGVVIQKIILVLENFVYINLDELPNDFPDDGEYKFSMDRNGLTLNAHHPLVIIYNLKDSTGILKVEEYIYFRIEEYPESTLILRSVKLPPREHLSAKIQISKNYLDINIKNITKIPSDEEFLSKLKAYSFPITNFLQNNQLTSSNFIPVMDSLLQIYDLSVQKVYKTLYRENATVEGAAGEFSTIVENLKDNISLDRLINPYDIIVLQDNSLKPPRKYRGLIYKVRRNKVIFSVRSASQKNKLHPGRNFTIDFFSARTKFLYQYHAIRELTNPLKNYLFPSEIKGKKTGELELEPTTLKIFNETIQSNPEQLQAVLNIAGKGSWDNQCPYVIFGPPGTGKTTTVVECILQVYHENETNTILVSANSNAACDEVAKRLKKYLYLNTNRKPVMLRIYSGTYGKKLDLIDEDLFEVTNVAHEYHLFPTIEVFRSYRIIVATHDIAAKYLHSGLSKEKIFFSHIFIDENGATTVPEALCSVVGFWKKSTKLILSGDPKQLSALIEDKRTKSLGFEVSLMERLMETPIYKEKSDGTYNINIQSRLCRNYRCHPEILNMFSTLCYDGKLMACGGSEKLNKAVDWFKLVNPTIPIVFHSSYDHSRTQRNETSMFNREEIRIVIQYVQELIFFGLKGQQVIEKDIGIVSPYKEQCLLIKKELEKRNWFDIDVGSAETYQGKEKPIVIMSTVRSKTKTIGFLDNLRRLNVMISRAEALLIIVGNPDTLTMDPNWERLVDTCKAKGVFIANIPLSKGKKWKSIY
ncbi:MOV10.2 family protein [Megaselia abdita]